VFESCHSGGYCSERRRESQKEYRFAPLCRVEDRRAEGGAAIRRVEYIKATTIKQGKVNVPSGPMLRCEKFTFHYRPPLSSNCGSRIVFTEVQVAPPVVRNSKLYHGDALCGIEAGGARPGYVEIVMIRVGPSVRERRERVHSQIGIDSAITGCPL